MNLASPISEYLPAMKGLKVGVEKPDGTLELVPMQREPTVLDLLRHTSGLVYGLGSSAVRKLYRAANLDAATDGVDYIADSPECPFNSSRAHVGPMDLRTMSSGTSLKRSLAMRLEIL